MISLLPTQAAEWARALTNFDGTYKSVTDNVAALSKLQSKLASWPADMQSQYRALVKDGLAAKSKLQGVKATRDKVRGWLDTIKSFVGLSALPVLWVAVSLTAFLAAVAVGREFLNGSAGFARRLQAFEAAQKQLQAKGVPAAEAARQAAAIASQLAGEADAPGLLEKLGGKALWIGAGLVLAYLLLPHILGRINR